MRSSWHQSVILWKDLIHSAVFVNRRMHVRCNWCSSVSGPQCDAGFLSRGRLFGLRMLGLTHAARKDTHTHAPSLAHTHLYQVQDLTHWRCEQDEHLGLSAATSRVCSEELRQINHCSQRTEAETLQKFTAESHMESTLACSCFWGQRQHQDWWESRLDFPWRDVKSTVELFL